MPRVKRQREDADDIMPHQHGFDVLDHLDYILNVFPDTFEKVTESHGLGAISRLDILDAFVEGRRVDCGWDAGSVLGSDLC